MPSADGVQHDTFLDRNAMPGLFGFQPTSRGPNMQGLMTRCSNRTTQAAHFASLYPGGIPDWWFKHRYNEFVSFHLYRMSDMEHGSNLTAPMEPPAVCQHVVQDFRSKEMKCLALLHSSAVSAIQDQPWNQKHRPFLSTGRYLDSLHVFANQKEKIARRHNRVFCLPSLYG